MNLTKRQRQQLENALVKALTVACETAKVEIAGFEWLTHDYDQNNFPTGLRIIWIFDQQQTMDDALQAGLDARMYSLTQIALTQAGLGLAPAHFRVTFDNEQACQRVDQGDWKRRLFRTRRMH